MQDEEIDLLRSLLAHAYERRQPFLLRIVRAVKDVWPAPPEEARHPESEYYREEKGRGLDLSTQALKLTIEIL